MHIARNELIRRDPELIRTVLRGAGGMHIISAQHLMSGAAFGAKLYGTTEDVMRSAIDRELPRFQLDGGWYMIGLQKSVDLQFELGGIKGPMNVWISSISASTNIS